MLEQLVGWQSFVALAKIGVADMGIDPALEFSDLGGDSLAASWLAGTVEPITSKRLATLLIATLPQSTLTFLGKAFIFAGLSDDENHIPNKVRQIQEIGASSLEGLDDLLDEPIVAVNPAASVRQIQADLRTALKTWKEERNIADDRPQPKKYPDYLSVWDAREGFVEGRYVRSEESTLIEIAKSTGKTISTINNQYQRAFQLVPGHPYSIGNWLTLFGVFKLSSILGEIGTAGTRPLNERSTRDVPDSVLRPGEELSISDTRTASPTGWAELALEISGLIENDLTDDQIVDSLGLRHPEIVPEIRLRGTDELL